MENIKVVVQQADNDHRELPWPYSHVPRIGERFTIAGVGSKHAVTDVFYNHNGGDFIAVVVVSPCAQ